MHGSVKFISFVFIFLAFLCLVYDVAQMARYKEEMKNALDLSTKAAALQVDLDPAKIARGEFDIDETLSKAAFEEYMRDNLNQSSNDVMVFVLDYKPINTRVPVDYINPGDGKRYLIEAPTFIAVLRYEYKGLLFSQTVTLNNLSGATVRVAK